MIVVEVDSKAARNMLDGYSRSIPDAAEEGAFKVATRIQNELRTEIQTQRLMDSLNLINKTRAEKLSKNVSVVKMPQYGVGLDRASPHYVSLKRGRKIGGWAERKYGTQVRTGLSKVYRKGGTLEQRALGGKVRGGYVYVTPHPFIIQAFTRAMTGSKTIINREVNGAIRGRGR